MPIRHRRTSRVGDEGVGARMTCCNQDLVSHSSTHLCDWVSFAYRKRVYAHKFPGSSPLNGVVAIHLEARGASTRLPPGEPDSHALPLRGRSRAGGDQRGARRWPGRRRTWLVVRWPSSSKPPPQQHRSREVTPGRVPCRFGPSRGRTSKKRSEQKKTKITKKAKPGDYTNSPDQNRLILNNAV